MTLAEAQRTNPSILVVVGLLMAVIVLLGVTGMLSALVVAQVNQGMATAVNQSGTLRMQSYRIGVALADDSIPLARRQEQVRRLTREYAQRLTSPRLSDALPDSASDPVRLAYERVRRHWTHVMRQAAERFVAAGADARAAGASRALYLEQVDGFVDDIHALVWLLEERSEHHIELLRWIQAVVLAATVAAVLVTLVVVRNRIVTPLAELLDCAERARRGDFSGRTRCIGTDELGRVGAAMNLMTRDLSRIYGELEERVADKTRDLARSNRSLAFLYRTSRALEESPVTEQLLAKVLEDARGQLDLAEMALCLRDPYVLGKSGACIGTGQARRPSARCPSEDCDLCDGPELAAPLAWSAGGQAPSPGRIASLAVGDQDHRFGTLRVVPAPDKALEPWQRPLLKSLARHLATALNLMGRMHEGRRLALYEERGILARELHDSLAQSLSYLKIQATRLDVALREPEASAERGLPPPPAILAEIRDGISSAYRQLRELLTTFRLRIDGQGLTNALAETAKEFRGRADVDIALDDRLPPGLLSPNEEVHVLQIIREALSNVVQHAAARHCDIRLDATADTVGVRISDDGKGLRSRPTGRGHYGIAIMRERAVTLGGSIRVESGAGGGTSVSLSFRARGG